MAMPLKQAIDLAVRGKFPPDGVRVDGHDFFIRALVHHELIGKGETGFFRHQHLGKDDRLFYTINVLDKANGTYSAKITRVQFRGPFNSGMKKLGAAGIEVAGLLKASDNPKVEIFAQMLEKILKTIKDLNLQAFFDGDFVTAAAKIVDIYWSAMKHS